MTAIRSDYQQFNLSPLGVRDIGERMRVKMGAVPLPDMNGKRVLDVGCDFGFWSFLAADIGAAEVVGIDRGRKVPGVGDVDIVAHNRAQASEHSYKKVRFEYANLGQQWLEFGQFDIVLMLSMYHHFFAQCGDHKAIFFWLWRQLAPGGVVIWENPVDTLDGVAYLHIPDALHAQYNQDAIISAAYRYFHVEYIGAAEHEPHRKVFTFTRKEFEPYDLNGLAVHGAGGSSKAFAYAGGRRMVEIDVAMGFHPMPGSFNVMTEHNFDWDNGYYRTQILDWADRSSGFDGEVEPRWARLYPVAMCGVPCYAFRFEGESYPLNFVELISDTRLRDVVKQDRVSIRCP